MFKLANSRAVYLLDGVFILELSFCIIQLKDYLYWIFHDIHFNDGRRFVFIFPLGDCCISMMPNTFS